MNDIIITTLVITLIGIAVGAGLVYASKKFYVKVDEREAAVRTCLPGNNCGACGFAGCDAMAAAIVAGEAPVNGCPVGGNAAAEKIAVVMDVTAEETERHAAFVRCSGTCDVTGQLGHYVGISDCRSAVMAGLNLNECSYGCLGLGSCVSACPQNAIKVINGVAVVNEKLCVSCGLCVKACPKGLIELKPVAKKVAVRCSNKDKGAVVKNICKAGCIGCMACTKQCESDAVHVENNLASIDYEKCIQCGKCAEKCPVHVITQPAQTAAKEV
ncbi:MAG: RnfABCDGE type electron transport complex subunit B [Eubacteriaceae bacterium]|nr:RnfABCDGE type electron transport complex subunit B [Eubacteriaceae bacterium]